MDKPVILKVKELTDGIIQLINNSELPAFILKLEMEKIYNSICQLEQNEYTNALEEYKKSKKVKEDDK